MRPFRQAIAILGAAALLVSCATKPPSPPPKPAEIPAIDRRTLTPVTFSELPGWTQDHVVEAIPALKKSCDRIMQLPTDRVIGNDGSAGVAADWSGACGALRWLKADDDAAVRSYLQDWFHPLKVGNGHGDDGQFTGYYEAELRGSTRQSPRYFVPLLGRPPGQAADPGPDSCCSRAEIEAGALKDKAPVLLWVDDPVDAHILSIQGSGRVTLEDGSTVRVAYAGNNGRPFVGIGKILADRGKISDKTMPSVRAWLKAHPAEAPALMAENPRYVFFRILKGDGPVGAFSVPLTPGRSLAVDPHFVPLGIPIWLDTKDADGNKLQRLVVAQDIGKAITGVIRGDFYWGSGEAAFDKAGRMNSHGGYFLILPQQRSAPLALAQKTGD